jgi:hypothetical protein
MAIRAARCVADNNHSISQHAEADHPSLAVVLASVFGFEVCRRKDELGVLEVEVTFS